MSVGRERMSVGKGFEDVHCAGLGEFNYRGSPTPRPADLRPHHAGCVVTSYKFGMPVAPGGWPLERGTIACAGIVLGVHGPLLKASIVITNSDQTTAA